MYQLTHWLESHMLTCFYKQTFGIDCPGCGMQRSFIELLKGNLLVSLQLYPALIPVMITLCITALHIMFKFKHGAKTIMYSFIVSVVIISISYITHLLK